MLAPWYATAFKGAGGYGIRTATSTAIAHQLRQNGSVPGTAGAVRPLLCPNSDSSTGSAPAGNAILCARHRLCLPLPETDRGPYPGPLPMPSPSHHPRQPTDLFSSTGNNARSRSAINSLRNTRKSRKILPRNAGGLVDCSDYPGTIFPLKNDCPPFSCLSSISWFLSCEEVYLSRYSAVRQQF
jgi:hypothetical protein